jgi:hypothetical protein
LLAKFSILYILVYTSICQYITVYQHRDYSSDFSHSNWWYHTQSMGYEYIDTQKLVKSCITALMKRKYYSSKLDYMLVYTFPGNGHLQFTSIY